MAIPPPGRFDAQRLREAGVALGLNQVQLAQRVGEDTLSAAIDRTPKRGSKRRKAGVLADVCAALAVGDSSKAKTILQEGYPFVPVEKIARRYSERESMKLFIRDGFIDRYTGNSLVNPGVLRLLHIALEDDFPADPNWKVSGTHPAFWELFPTVDHVVPVSRGGPDDESNWVTASMLRNQAKNQWTLEDLGWELHPPGAVAEWDGLSRWLVDYLAANPIALAAAAEPHRGYVRRWVIATKAALEEADVEPVERNSTEASAAE